MPSALFHNRRRNAPHFLFRFEGRLFHIRQVPGKTGSSQIPAASRAGRKTGRLFPRFGREYFFFPSQTHASIQRGKQDRNITGGFSDGDIQNSVAGRQFAQNDIARIIRAQQPASFLQLQARAEMRAGKHIERHNGRVVSGLRTHCLPPTEGMGDVTGIAAGFGATMRGTGVAGASSARRAQPPTGRARGARSV